MGKTEITDLHGICHQLANVDRLTWVVEKEGKMSTASPFNSALECSLRALAILASAYPASADLQRLVAYDYLLVHSADADGLRACTRARHIEMESFLFATP